MNNERMKYPVSSSFYCSYVLLIKFISLLIFFKTVFWHYFKDIKIQEMEWESRVQVSVRGPDLTIVEFFYFDILGKVILENFLRHPNKINTITWQQI